jgi:hypothetical protein
MRRSAARQSDNAKTDRHCCKASAAQKALILSGNFGGKPLCRRWKPALENAFEHQNQANGGQKVTHCAGTSAGFFASLPFTSRKNLKNSESGDRTIDVPAPCSDEA